jgi:hypothetical protein
MKACSDRTDMKASYSMLRVRRTRGSVLPVVDKEDDILLQVLIIRQNAQIDV